MYEYTSMRPLHSTRTYIHSNIFTHDSRQNYISLLYYFARIPFDMPSKGSNQTFFPLSSFPSLPLPVLLSDSLFLIFNSDFAFAQAKFYSALFVISQIPFKYSLYGTTTHRTVQQTLLHNSGKVLPSSLSTSPILT